MRCTIGEDETIERNRRPPGAAYGARTGDFGDQEGRADQQGRENSSTGLNWGVFLGAFAGSLIELAEILAVVLVVGSVAGWRNALAGAGSAVVLVVVVALIVGKGLALIPVHALEFVAGVILLAFGQMWARSVIKYYGGILQPKDDEDERLRDQLRREGRPAWNLVALVAAFKSSLLESVEIAIVVVGFGLAGGDWFESIGGALMASIGLIIFAILLRAPLARVPVKAMKYVASMLLLGFGTYWLGEGLGYEWPTGSWSLLWLPLLWGLLMAAGTEFLRLRLGEAAGTPKPPTRGGSKPPGGRP
jgi:uncharacterized membrane protein